MKEHKGINDRFSINDIYSTNDIFSINDQLQYTWNTKTFINQFKTYK